ncbi:11145_t:CDS:2 [Paraglomus brasilianum]|uniref:11145_t:CDS:1 n=1 Tax=Paraglomus brasilianum TaxID=144538 RepID=A0A9N9DCT4_9GLOM|nr:11145_t:CDS:2 [Paraglomus brasilianum]
MSLVITSSIYLVETAASLEIVNLSMPTSTDPGPEIQLEILTDIDANIVLLATVVHANDALLLQFADEER